MGNSCSACHLFTKLSLHSIPAIHNKLHLNTGVENDQMSKTYKSSVSLCLSWAKALDKTNLILMAKFTSSYLGFEAGQKAIHYYDMKMKQVKKISQNYHFLPHAENPDEELWEPRDLEKERRREKEPNDTPLTIRILKHSNVSQESDEESEDEIPPKQQKTKSSDPYVSAEWALHANVISTQLLI